MFGASPSQPAVAGLVVLKSWITGVEADAMRENRGSELRHVAPGEAAVAVSPELIAEYASYGNLELRTAFRSRETAHALSARRYTLSRILDRLARSNETCFGIERKAAWLGKPGSWMSVETLIAAACIRRDLRFEVRTSTVAAALDDVCETGRYWQMRAYDGKLWIAAKKGAMSLLERTRLVSGIRDVSGAREITLAVLDEDPVLKKQNYLVMVSFIGGITAATEAVERVMRQIIDKRRMTISSLIHISEPTRPY